jgi:hypothetical protein
MCRSFHCRGQGWRRVQLLFCNHLQRCQRNHSLQIGGQALRRHPLKSLWAMTTIGDWLISVHPSRINDVPLRNPPAPMSSALSLSHATLLSTQRNLFTIPTTTGGWNISLSLLRRCRTISPRKSVMNGEWRVSLIIPRPYLGSEDFPSATHSKPHPWLNNIDDGWRPGEFSSPTPCLPHRRSINDADDWGLEFL